ncbi:MAG: hypothetical protein COC22_01995 [Flavobacteriaceae bacterium]|nr:MAG: hypothetical protein COC22_01995 [Flavobacteriaceae bacterium]
MKIAIHHRENSFSSRWISFCELNKINFILVNCYDSNILNLLKNEKVTHLMYSMTHESSTDIMLFPYVLNAADKMGIKTFPNFNTRWHFDDKIAQKYLFESINAPLVKSYIFYEKEEAINFINNSKLPLVTKLKRGAGSTNVKLIKTVTEGVDYVSKLFSTGIISTSKPLEHFEQKLRIAKQIKNPILLFKKVIGFLKKNRRERSMANVEKGYAYFQEFMPNNDFDTRIIAVGDIAFGIRRFNKVGDFKASGSGKIDYSVNKIDVNMVSIAFKTTEAIGAQCLAFDFVYDSKNAPKIIEICFLFSMLAYDKCEGYWNRDLIFKEGKFNPQELMIENFIS